MTKPDRIQVGDRVAMNHRGVREKVVTALDVARETVKAMEYAAKLGFVLTFDIGGTALRAHWLDERTGLMYGRLANLLGCKDPNRRSRDFIREVVGSLGADS